MTEEEKRPIASLIKDRDAREASGPTLMPIKRAEHPDILNVLVGGGYGYHAEREPATPIAQGRVRIHLYCGAEVEEALGEYAGQDYPLRKLDCPGCLAALPESVRRWAEQFQVGDKVLVVDHGIETTVVGYRFFHELSATTLTHYELACGLSVRREGLELIER